MKPSKRALDYAASAIFCLAMLAGAAARAQTVSTFNFNFTFDYNLSTGGDYGPLQGAFTATGGNGDYVITSINGTLGGYSISLLAPSAFAGNDNTLSYPANPGYFTLGGVSFVANGVDLNLYYYNGVTAITPVNALGYGGVYSGTVTQVGAPAPAPGTGLLSFAGLCVAGLGKRFKPCVAVAKGALRHFSAARSMGRPRGEPA